MPSIDQSVALGVGAAGALVDVSSYVDLQAGITYQWGRQSGFEDVRPGEVTFTLDNGGGRFTPDNAASPLDTTLVEGAKMCWQSGSRLVEGTVREIRPAFPGDESAWAQVQVVADDLLGDAARDDSPMPQGLAQSVDADLVFLFDDRGPFAKNTGYWSGPVPDWGFGAAAEFGVDGPPGGPDTQVELTAAAATSVASQLVDSKARVLGTAYFGDNGLGAAFIITPLNLTSYFDFRSDMISGFRIGIQNEWLVWYTPAGSYAQVMQLSPNISYAVCLYISGGVRYLRVNGVDRASSALTPTFVQEPPQIIIGDAAYGESAVRLSSLILGNNSEIVDLGFGFDGATAETRAEGIAASLGITLTTTDLPTELLGAIEPGTRLDQLNSLARTIGGSLYCSTSGTLTNPTTTLNITGAIRPPTVTAAFDAETELSGAPDFLRDTTDMVSSVRVDGPNDRVTVNYGSATNLQLRSRVGSSNASETVDWQQTAHLVFWGQDRLNRGLTTAVRAPSFTVDAMTTHTDRSSDLLAVTPGVRLQLTNLPETQLGFDTSDGWVLGCDESHTLTNHDFGWWLEQVLPATAIFDTDRFAGGTTLTLSAGINASVTSISVATSAVKMTTTEVPFNITLDDEILTVTACTSATPQVLTVTRGAAGTTAASHSSAAVVELTTPALFAY